MKRYLLIPIILLLLTACEPFTPEAGQQIVVVTDTPPAGVIVTQTPFTPAVNTPIPTLAPPTATPTLAVIPTATMPPCDETEGRLMESAFNSQVTGELVPYNLYLPPCFFQSGRRYPYLILLHGSGHTYQQWDELGIKQVMDAGLADKSLPPMVIVMPEGGITQENNIFTAGASYEDMLLNDLIPHLEMGFCLITSRAGRAIGGISRGGFWSFSIAFRNPEYFGAVGGHSPFFVPDNAPPTHNPLGLAASAVGIEALRIYLDHSQSDLGGSNVAVFASALTNRGISYEYQVDPNGDHDNEYWSEHLPDYLAFYGANWLKEAAGLPTCEA